MKTRKKRFGFAALLLTLAVSLSACGSGDEAKATSMHLIRTEGQVAVADDAGKDIPLLENLGLYSGYGVGTQSASYAWINLDDVKLTKMDQDSEVSIRKDDKQLEILVDSGSLFFNVTEPLPDGETMHIRTSTMAIGIRGTCGWAEVPDAGHMNLYLLEGTVECTAGEQSASVSAGEMAAMTESGQIEVQPFRAQDVPDFVLAEIETDSGLAQAILDDSGLDVLNPEDPAQLALEQYRTVIAQADTYDYSSFGTPTGYRYALVQLQPEDAVPTLLLEQETSEYVSYARVFQYDPESGAMHQPAEALMEGSSMVGGFRGGLAMQADGRGISVSEFWSGTGESSTTRVTLAGDALSRETQWQGMFGEESNIPDATPITWYDVSGTSALDNWPEPGDPAEAAAAEQTAEETEPEPADSGALPTDGDRIVFRGMLKSYTYDEVVALQGSPDPNGGYDAGTTFWLLVLDTPQTMSLGSADPTSSYREVEVDVIDVTYADGLDALKQYDGQQKIFSVDPSTTVRPSDTSLPLGKPRTSSEIHVLG